MAKSNSNKIIDLISSVRVNNNRKEEILKLIKQLKPLHPQSNIQRQLEIHVKTLEKCFARGFNDEDQDIFFDTIQLVQDTLDLYIPKPTEALTLSLI